MFPAESLETLRSFANPLRFELQTQNINREVRKGFAKVRKGN
jgi:hypothetical protein